jgi:hypothetical protein
MGRWIAIIAVVAAALLSMAADSCDTGHRHERRRLRLLRHSCTSNFLVATRLQPNGAGRAGFDGTRYHDREPGKSHVS